MASDTQQDTREEVESRSDSTATRSEGLFDEVCKALQDLSNKINEGREDPGGSADTASADFGKIELYDSKSSSDSSGQEKATVSRAGDGDVGPIGDGAKDKTTQTPDSKIDVAAAAKQFEDKGMAGLAEANKDLKFTTDGSPPREVPYQDQFKVKADAGLTQLAREQLGPNATEEQVKDYAGEIKSLNHLKGKRDEITIHAGDTIKLPGQDKDGGIYKVVDGDKQKHWSNGTSLDTHKDGTHSAYYEKDGVRYSTEWNPANLERNHQSADTDLRSVETRADGSVTTIDRVMVKKQGDDGEMYDTAVDVKKSISKGGELLQYDYDKEGNLTKETQVSADGRKVTQNLKDGKWDGKTTIEEPGGFKTVLEKSADGKSTTGNRMDSHGNVVEKAAAISDKLVYTDAKTGAQRAEHFEKGTEEDPGYKMGDLGKYNANTGELTKDAGPIGLETSFAKGRTDIVLPNGVISGTTTRGEVNFVNEKTGEATVIHPDGTGVYLHGDGTIDRWGPETSDNAKGEKLAPAEQEYLKNHKDVDLRDFAEIHRRFDGDPQKLEKFYAELAKLDTSKNVTEAEKSAIRHDIMHHVAEPAEIYQGVTDSCNVTVVQRDLAISNPEKYAQVVVHAISDGAITVAPPPGQEVKLDVNNLKMADSSGRDLASRIFQTAAIHAEFWPDKDFVNTPDGVGRLKPGPDAPKGSQTEVFEGLLVSEIADVRYKVTGEEKAVGYVGSVEELNKAIELNGGVPMTVIVDGGAPPFNGAGSDHSPNHIVTITGIEQGPPVKYLVQNQWGLESDHSTKGTAIPADELLANMRRHRKEGEKDVTEGYAIVISKGDHTKAYDIYTNGMAEDTKATENNRDARLANRKPKPATPAKK